MKKILLCQVKSYAIRKYLSEWWNWLSLVLGTDSAG